jgi:hypothetical protein
VVRNIPEANLPEANQRPNSTQLSPIVSLFFWHSANETFVIYLSFGKAIPQSIRDRPVMRKREAVFTHYASFSLCDDGSGQKAGEP